MIPTNYDNENRESPKDFYIFTRFMGVLMLMCLLTGLSLTIYAHFHPHIPPPIQQQLDDTSQINQGKIEEDTIKYQQETSLDGGFRDDVLEVFTDTGLICVYTLFQNLNQASCSYNGREVAKWTSKGGWKISDSASVESVKQLIIRNKTDSL